MARWIPQVSGDVRRQMEHGLITLAQFQPGVGEVRYPGGVSPDLLEAAMTADTKDAAKMILAASDGPISLPNELQTRLYRERRELLAFNQSLG